MFTTRPIHLDKGKYPMLVYKVPIVSLEHMNASVTNNSQHH